MSRRLTDEFQKYVGVIIKDPHRVTADLDTADGMALAKAARDSSLMLVFRKAGEPEEPFMCDVEALFVTITKEGVTDDKPWGWRVEHLNVG